MSEDKDTDDIIQFETIVVRDFRILDQRFTAYASKNGLNNTEIGVLVAIATDIKTNLADLSKRVNVSESAVSQAITGLMKKKFVRSEADSKDRRRHFLTPTAKGDKVVQDFRANERTLIDALSKEMGPGFMPSIIKLVETAREYGFTQVETKHE